MLSRRQLRRTAHAAHLTEMQGLPIAALAVVLVAALVLGPVDGGLQDGRSDVPQDATTTIRTAVGGSPSAIATSGGRPRVDGDKDSGTRARATRTDGLFGDKAVTEDVEEPSTRSPKLDVEWLVPTRTKRPITFDPDAEAEVINVTRVPPTATTITSTPTSTSALTSTSAPATISMTSPPPQSSSASTVTPSLTSTPTATSTSTLTPPSASTPIPTPVISVTTPVASSTTLVPRPGDGVTPESSRPIVSKCCPLGQRVLSEKKKCVDSPLEFIPPFVEYDEEVPEAAVDGTLQGSDQQGKGVDGGAEHEQPEPFVTEAEGYDIIVGNPCKHGRFRLEPHVDDGDEFYLLANGSLVAPYLFDVPLGTDEFCMDVFPDTGNGDVMVLPLVCFPAREGPRRTGIQFILYPIGLLLSVPFLLTTLVLYAITPALRDVHGKALMCQVTCQAVAYSTLAFVQLWGAHFNRSLCFATACVVQFSFFACFLWLNVMCINTWYNMVMRPAQKWCRRVERRRFVLYSMYAWSLPCVLLGVTVVIDLTPTIPSSYIKPRFGIDTCWFQSDGAALPYFYGPVTLLVLINVVLFVLTACSLHRQRRRRALNSSAMPLTNDTCYKRHSTAAFTSCLYLFGAMGLNWTMEVVSFFVGGPPFIWYATDTLNCLQGAWTFIIFVLNRPARREIRARVVLLRSQWAAADEYRACREPDAPQIDDFKTVVNRQSIYAARLSPWQEQLASQPNSPTSPTSPSSPSSPTSPTSPSSLSSPTSPKTTSPLFPPIPPVTPQPTRR